MSIKEIRSKMALVSQDATLFDMSIRDNIKYGDLTRAIPDEEIILAAQRANIHEFIASLPEVRKSLDYSIMLMKYNKTT